MAVRRLRIYEKPQCLIYTDFQGRLAYDDHFISELGTLDKPLVVVAIAGAYRTGKSYLLNRLAGKSNGFALGATIQSKTKGIWIWVREHKLFPDRYLVLLDTEGLGDVEKGDANHDNYILSLATLLSSTLIYNVLSAINEDAISKMHFVTEISKHIRIKANPDQEPNADVDIHFPLFIFALRDFSLDLDLNGRTVSPKEYLEQMLTLKQGDSDAIKRYNECRFCIRKYFKRRECFVFDCPGPRSKLKNLERLPDSEISPDFISDTEKFLKFVYAKCPVKKLEQGQDVNGKIFAALVTAYVNAIRNGAVPCIESAITSLALLENQKALNEAVEVYKVEMEKSITTRKNVFHHRSRNLPVHHSCCYCNSNHGNSCCCYSAWCCHSGCCCCCCLDCRLGCSGCYLGDILRKECRTNHFQGTPVISLPADESTVNAHHWNCLHIAVRRFLDKAIMDEDGKFLKQLNIHIGENLNRYMEANVEASTRRCRAFLGELESPLREKLTSGRYARSGGFVDIKWDLEELQRQYNLHDCLGPKKEETLVAYLQEREKDLNSVLAADTQVANAIRLGEIERQKAVEADRQRIQAEKQAELERQRMQSAEVSWARSVQQLQANQREKIQQTRQQFHQNLKAKQDEQSRLLKEGFHKEADNLRQQIKNIRR